MDLAKQALLLLAIDPTLKGVLIAAGPGTAKSVLARSFKSLLVDENDECRMQNDELKTNSLSVHHSSFIIHRSFIDVPLSVTEDRLLGGLDLERTIITGRPQVTHGLLAQAHTGVLYVDEINLLDRRLAQHIANALSTGVVSLEREGLSAQVPADFMFIGTYDPGEGGVSPALVDCVGMHVAQLGTLSPQERAELVTRVLAFNRDSQAFAAQYASQSRRLRRLVAEARSYLPEVEIRPEDQRRLALMAWQLGVEGHRADIFALRVARASAAFNGRSLVQEDDLQAALQLVFQWRNAECGMRNGRRLPSAIRHPPSAFQRAEIRHLPSATRNANAANPPSAIRHPSSTEDLTLPPLDCHLPDDLLNLPHARQASRALIGRGRVSQGRGDRAETMSRIRGRYVGAVAGKSGPGKIALDATLRAAAPLQKWRRQSASTDNSTMAVRITVDDLRWKRFKQKAGMLIIFVVDASGSMALNRINQAKGAVIRLLHVAYRHRDKVALISFRGDRAEVLLPPSQSVELAKRALDAQPVGGGTPLTAGLLTALDLVKRAPRQRH